MPEVLELTHLREQHRVTDVEIGTRGIEAGLHTQRLAALARLLEAQLELALDVQVDDAAREHGHLLGNGRETVRHDRRRLVRRQPGYTPIT